MLPTPRRAARRARAAIIALAVACAAVTADLGALPASATIGTGQVTTRHMLQFSGSNAWAHLDTLMSYNPRYPGTAGINLSAEYIKSTLSMHGGIVIEQPFTVNGIPCKNIVGKWPVTGSPSAEIVILASHYDARARASQDPDPTKWSSPVPAANDGGSSTAILLEMARLLHGFCSNGSLGITREAWLVFFDAEDQGNDGNGVAMAGFDWIMGSQHMAQDLAALAGDACRVKVFILLDLVGAPGFQADQELNSDQQLLAGFFSMGRCLGHGTYFPTSPDRHPITDDHVPFINLGIGIQCIDVIDLGYPQWHTTADDLAHVSPGTILAIGKVAEGFLLTKIAPATSFSIGDPATGRTWTAGSCTSDAWLFEFMAFLARYWWLLVLAGVALVLLVYEVKRRRVARGKAVPSAT